MLACLQPDAHGLPQFGQTRGRTLYLKTQILPPPTSFTPVGTTINSALGLGAPQTTKDFLVMQKRETQQRVRQWEVLVRRRSGLARTKAVRGREEGKKGGVGAGGVSEP